MPQLILEYTSNVLEKDNMRDLFKKCHIALTEILPAEMNACKSRAFELDNYYIGDGDSNRAMVHLEVAALDTRPKEIRDQAAEALMQILKEHFKGSLEKLALQITLEFRLLADIYLKTTK